MPNSAGRRTAQKLAESAHIGEGVEPLDHVGEGLRA
jgi:hypothetical protein